MEMTKILLLILIIMILIYLATIPENINNENNSNQKSTEISNLNQRPRSLMDRLMEYLFNNKQQLSENKFSKNTFSEQSQSERDITEQFSINEEVSKDQDCKKENDTNGKCEAGKCGNSDLHPILDPRFNMRETAKQCLLLEDHLNNKNKRCEDCIRKHFLTIDGFLEEAVSLEKDNAKRDYYRDLYKSWVRLEKEYSTNPKDMNNIDEISKKIRLFRKPLVEMYFDTVSEYDI